MRSDDISERLRQFEVLCRQRGLPLTVQRREILKTILERDDHPSADQIYESVKDRLAGLSRTTVYRVLDTLVELGMIRRLHHPGAGARFDSMIHRHHHLVCRQCGGVMDIEARDLDDLKLPPALSQGFGIEDYSVHFTGLCRSCLRQGSP